MEETRRLGLKKRFLTAAAAVVVALPVGGWVVGNRHSIGDGVSRALSPMSYCGPPVDDEGLGRVRQGLAAPIGQEHVAMLPLEPGTREHDDRLYPYLADRAAAHNLTVIDARPYLDRIRVAPSEAELFTAVNDYTRHFGFTTEVWDNREPTNMFYEPVPLQEGALDRATEYRRGASQLVRTVSYMPVEYVRFSEVRQVLIIDRFARGFYDANKRITEIGGTVDYERHQVLMTIGSFVPDVNDDVHAGRVFSHELSHLERRARCPRSAVYFDKDLTSLNPPGFKYGTPDAVASGATVNSHGALNLAEDIATVNELTSPIVLPEVWRNPPSDVVMRKIELGLARRNQQVPGAGDFAIEISPRSHTLSPR